MDADASPGGSDTPPDPTRTDPGSASIPWSSPVLHVILAATLMGVMGVSLISPALPAIRDALGATESETALLLSAFTLPGVVLGPVVGVLADKYGRRRLLVPCLIVYGVSGGAVMLTQSLMMAVAVRVVQGAAAAGLITLAVTLVGDVFDGPQRNAVLGANGAILSVGTASYPLIGGALSEIDWRAPFAMYLIGIPAGLFALRVLEDTRPAQGPRGLAYFTGALRVVPRMRAVLLYGSGLVIFILLYGGVLTAVPFLLDREVGASAVAIGLTLTASSVASAAASLQAGKLARRFSEPAIIAAGLVCHGVSLVGLSWAPNVAWSSVAILFFGAGMGFAMPALDAAVSKLGPGQYRGGLMSLRTSMIRLGQTIGPALFTMLAVSYGFGYRPLLLGGGVAALVLGGTALVASLWVRPRASQ